jgi:hypothetical protein
MRQSDRHGIGTCWTWKAYIGTITERIRRAADMDDYQTTPAVIILATPGTPL